MVPYKFWKVLEEVMVFLETYYFSLMHLIVIQIKLIHVCIALL